MAGRGRVSGITVDPARVRAARLAAGLSLADIAGADVSRTQIYFIEHGQTRPSRRVLELIARRTGKPVTYFIAADAEAASKASLSRQLAALAKQAHRFADGRQLSHAEREALKLIEVNLRQAALLARSLELRRRQRPRHSGP